MSTEDKKQVASQAYAIEHYTDADHLDVIENAWLAGFEAGTPKWINAEDELPEAWSQHRNRWESDEVLLDCGDFYVVSRYVRKYDKGVQNLIWEGFDNIEDQEIAERWQKIAK